MSDRSGDRHSRSIPTGVTRFLVRWECRCQEPPVLLATYDDRGRIHIKSRDRYWHVLGTVHTVCPRCGSEHALDLRRAADGGRREEGVDR